MKTLQIIMLLSIVLIGNGCKKSKQTLTIGQSYQGGIIAYIDQTGQHGLIAANQDLPSTAGWGCKGTVMSTNVKGYGKGLENTNKISSLCQDLGAAKKCFDLIQDGYSDWFLPSEIELSYLEENLFLANKGNFRTDLPYWSSTEVDPSMGAQALGAWLKIFGGSGLYTDKNGFNLVRPCRYF
jgi:hypothetical protein